MTVIAIDTNVLVYAHRREATEHDKALEVIRALAASANAWAIPWPCVYEFFSVVTNRRVWKDAASTPEQAWAQLESWFGAPNLRLIHETEAFTQLLERFVKRPRVRGPIVHDARVAAICVAHGVEKLVSRDRDFSLFPEVVVTSPF
jgi:uncharacterized protein